MSIFVTTSDFFATNKLTFCFIDSISLVAMSHLSDEDDEFLYGSDSEKKSNPLLDNKNGEFDTLQNVPLYANSSKTDVDGLYDLYEDNEAKILNSKLK